MSRQTIAVERDVVADRRAAAERFRERLAGQGTLVVHLLGGLANRCLSSPWAC
jgi:hypothetical protein